VSSQGSLLFLGVALFKERNFNMQMTPELRGFVQRLIQMAIHSGIQSIFFRLPLGVIVVVVGLLIWAAVHFQLY
jgi:hypothetical protein